MIVAVACLIAGTFAGMLIMALAMALRRASDEGEKSARREETSRLLRRAAAEAEDYRENWGGDE